MAEIRFLSKIEQVAAFLRAELTGGRLEGAMPGRVELPAELGSGGVIKEKSDALIGEVPIMNFAEEIDTVAQIHAVDWHSRVVGCPRDTRSPAADKCGVRHVCAIGVSGRERGSFELATCTFQAQVSRMAEMRFLSRIEQVAAFLRAELAAGRWEGAMPGRMELAAELGLCERTVEEAVRLLEREGVLVPQGAGRRRLIAVPKDFTARVMRVKILPYEESDRKQYFLLDALHRLLNMGHSASYASKSLKDLGMDLSRVRRYVQKEEADAWMIMAGSKEILDWFAQQATPAFAIAGRRRGIPIAGIGPDKIPARGAAVRRLIALGHRRIAMLVREERRNPTPGLPERAFLEELEAHGIQTGRYNLPDWKDDANDFHRCLHSLFQHTPPTALLVDEMQLFVATQQHLAQRGILAPQDVSLICLDPHPVFAWSLPSVAHINWDIAPVVRRMINWADNVARGKDDRRQSFTPAEFVEGGTIGPVKC